MALVVKDRVKETTTTTGTGTITLAGAVDGFQSFSAALADGDTTYYAISETSTGEWEVGLGTFTATGTTLARTTVLASSNAGSAVSLTAEADVFITQPASKSVFFDGSGDLTLNQDPTSALHAATKEYVDTIAAAGLHYHDPVRVEQEGNLSATYDNGTAGVGATLTNNSTQAALSIDGVTLSLNDRVLIYEQTNAYENGVYTVTDTGSASTNWVLTRSTDTDSYAPSDPDSLGQGDAFFVLEGAAGAGELYVMNTEGTITFGTTGITFTQVAATAVFTAGDGLTLTGTTFAVGAGTGVTVNANDIAIGQAVGTSDSPTFAGMTTTADITFGTNDKASFGTTLDIYSDGTDSYVVESGTGNLYIDSADLSIRNAAGTATMASFDDTGSVTLNHNNSTKLTTQSYGIDVTGNVQSDGLVLAGDATFGDNDKAIFGAGSDLQIYHTGSVSVIADEGTGNLLIRGSDLRLQNAAGSNNYLKAVDGAEVELMHGGATKLSTTSTGIDVTGTVTADGLTVGAANGIVLDTSGATEASWTHNSVNGESTISVGRNSSWGGDLNINTDTLRRMRIQNNGDISFYEDTGTTAKFFWDASAERLGIGTSSPDAILHLEGPNLTGNTNPITLRFTDSDTASAANQIVGRIEFEGRDNSATGVGSFMQGVAQDVVGNQYLAFGTGTAGSASERMRITSSGDLLVGKTSTIISTAGTTLWEDGLTDHTRSGEVLRVNRLSTDGDIATFRKDGTTVGSIGSRSGVALTVSSSGSVSIYDTSASAGGIAISSNIVYPINNSADIADNLMSLGSSSYRFKDLYLSGAAYTHSIAKQTTDPIVINSTLSSSKALRVYYDMDIYNTINFTDASWNSQGSIAGYSSNIHLTPATGGAVQITSTNDAMLRLVGSNAWSGIQFSDSGSVTDYIWYNGGNGTFAIGGGGSNVSGKKLHVDGGLSVGASSDTTSTPTNGIYSEGGITAASGDVIVNQASVSYTSNDNTPVVGTTTTNRLHVNGSIQLTGNNDAIVFGRGTATFMKDEEIGFGWGGGWYMTDGTYLRVRNNKHIYSTGNITAGAFYGDGSNLTNLPAASGITSSSEINIQTTGSTSDIRLRTTSDGEVNVESGSDITWVFNGSASGSDAYYDVYKGSLGNLRERLYMNNYTSLYAHEIRNWASSSFSGKPVYSRVLSIYNALDNTASVYMQHSAYAGTTFNLPVNIGSDIRLKKDVEKIDNALDKLSKINGYNFTWKDTDRKDAGVIAQEIEEVMPHLINSDGIDNDENHFKSVNYNGLIGLLIEVVKEQQVQIKSLQDRIGN